MRDKKFTTIRVSKEVKELIDNITLRSQTYSQSLKNMWEVYIKDKTMKEVDNVFNSANKFLLK